MYSIFFIYLLKHPLRLDVYRCAYVICVYLCSSHWEVMCSAKRARHIIYKYVPYMDIYTNFRVYVMYECIGKKGQRHVLNFMRSLGEF